MAVPSPAAILAAFRATGDPFCQWHQYGPGEDPSNPPHTFHFAGKKYFGTWPPPPPMPPDIQAMHHKCDNDPLGDFLGPAILAVGGGALLAGAVTGSAAAAEAGGAEASAVGTSEGVSLGLVPQIGDSLSPLLGAGVSVPSALTGAIPILGAGGVASMGSDFFSGLFGTLQQDAQTFAGNKLNELFGVGGPSGGGAGAPAPVRQASDGDLRALMPYLAIGGGLLLLVALMGRR